MPQHHIPRPAAASHPTDRRGGLEAGRRAPAHGEDSMRPTLWNAATFTIWMTVGIAYVAVIGR
jgi:hypothetical protein